MEYSPTLCFAGFERKIDNYSKKSRKFGKGKNFFHDREILCRDRISIELPEAMSQQESLCRNKGQAERKPKTKIVVTSHNSVAT